MPETHPTTQDDRSLSPSKNHDAVAGAKRKPEAEPIEEPDRKAAKKQTTIEESFDTQPGQDSEMKEESSEQVEDANNGPGAKTHNGHANGKDDSNVPQSEPQSAVAESNDSNGQNCAVEETSERKNQMPSNILEKGVIYFFTRNRVGIHEADSVGDLQRTFFVLRPLSVGATLGDGVIQDLKNNRLFALPKKTFPKSASDRFMAFVEKSNATIQDLKEDFFKGSEYETKTQGTRHVDPITPLAEGVYAITRTENATTHLVYSTTIPSKLGEVQEDLGIKDQGSFIISVKNPERSGPAAAQLPQKPDFPKEIIEEFRGLAWSEVKPKYLDYEYCQILLIGENIEKGVAASTKDEKQNKDTPQEELEKLEHEDELRVQHLHGDDSIFDDLQISKKDYPQVLTTW